MLTKAEIQRLRSLRDKRQREALGLFVAEGEKGIGELLAAGFPFSEIFATEAWRPSAAVPPGVRITTVTTADMARISHYPTPSTVLAVGPIKREPLQSAALARGLTLALDRVQDPGNVGTLLRIADWFAIDRVLLSPDSADLFHQKVINASMGSFARVRTHTVDLADALALAPEEVPVLGCELTGADVHGLPALADAIIVIGSEGRGLSPAVAAHVTERITIPRFGLAQSLNAAIAAAIVCAHLKRTQP